MTDNELLFHYGIDFQNRAIYFGGIYNSTINEDGDTHEVNQMTVEICVRAVHKMAKSSKKPISIYMQSYGGDVYALLYLVDVILTTPCQFKFYGGGAIMSAATLIMAVCDERYLYPSARLLFHAGNSIYCGSQVDNEIQLEEERKIQKYLYDIYAKNSLFPAEFWEELCKRDLHITAQEAVQLGIADAVIEPLKRGNLRKIRTKNIQQKINPKKINNLVSNLFRRIKNHNIKKLQIHVPNDPVDPKINVEEDISQGDSGEVQEKENK